MKLRRPLIHLFLALITLVWSVACHTEPSTQFQTSNSRAGRPIEHAMGTTVVPSDPQRLVTLDGFALENLLALGYQPVGTALNGSVQQQPDFLQDQLAGVELLGSFAQPNLEKIVALKPDLILGTTGQTEQIYEQLAGIAPTVLANSDSSDDWKSILAKHAEALGKTQLAEQLMADYQARLQELQTQMGETGKTLEVSVVRIYPNAISVYLSNSFAGSILAEAGLSRPPGQRGRGVQQEISKESLDIADGDILFLWAYGGDSDVQKAQQAQAALAQLRTDPLWSQLEAVKEGKVYEVPGYWIGFGPLAANAVVDDLFRYLPLAHSKQ